MIRMLLIWAIVITGAVMCAWRMPMPDAIAVWAGIAAALCGLGALLISRQPIGMGTIAGILGSCVVRFGYRVGQGLLSVAIAISWLFWLIVGSATIAIFHFRDDLWMVLLLLSWLAVALGLMYITGVILVARKGGRVPGSLLKVAGFIVLILVGSVGLATTGHQSSALLLAGGPVALIGGGYGVFILVIVTVGRNARWN